METCKEPARPFHSFFPALHERLCISILPTPRLMMIVFEIKSGRCALYWLPTFERTRIHERRRRATL